MRKYYPGITLFKLLGALLVLLGHTSIPRLFDYYGHVAGLQQAVAVVVPCFYIISGFLAYRGWTGTTRPRVYIRRYLGGLAAIYLLMCGLALLIGNGTKVNIAPGSWHHALLPLVQVYLVMGPYTTLWFIPPLLFSVAFCYYFERRGWLYGAVALAAAGYLLAQLLAGTLRVVVEAYVSHAALYHWRYSTLLWMVATRYLGWGLPFVLTGVLIARHEAAFRALSVRWLTALTLGGVAAEFVVLNLLADSTYSWFTHPMLLTLLPLSAWLFYGVLHLRGEGIRRYQAAINRFSALLYFLHQPLLSLNLLFIGREDADTWKRTLTTSQIGLLMALTVLQAGLLTWLTGWLLARRPASLAGEPAGQLEPGQLAK